MPATYTWTNGQPAPRGFSHWSEWVWYQTLGVMDICQSVAEEDRVTLRENPDTDYAATEHSMALRAIPASELRTITRETVLGALDSAMVTGIKRGGAVESVYHRAEARLWTLGYTVEEDA